MKQKTNRLHFSTRTLAMVLSIVMLIGSIATGSMLNTFAAYLKDAAANSDAVSQAASEGSDIALNAIPSENVTDIEFEENEIVRGMKEDLANVGAKADLASTAATGDWYIVGNVAGGNDWSERDAVKLSAVTGGYSISIQLEKDKDFRFRHNSADYGANSSNDADRKVNSSTSNHTLKQASETFIWTGDTGTYTVTINSDGSKISFDNSVPGGGGSSGGAGTDSGTSFPESWHDTGSDSTATIYYDNSITQWSSVKFRIGRHWNHGGNAQGYTFYNMTKVTGTDNIYKCTISFGKYTAFYFTNGGTDGWATGDIETVASKGFTAYTSPKGFDLGSSTYFFIGQSATVGTEAAPQRVLCYGAAGGTRVNTASDYTTYKKSVTNTSVDHGTVVVNWTNPSGTAQTIAEGATTADMLIGTKLTVAMTPDTLYAAGNATVTYAGNAASVTIPAGGSTFTSGNTNTTVTGSFVYSEPTHEVTFNTSGSGSVVSSTGADVGEQTSSTITATPAYGYEFTGWTFDSGITGESDSENPTTITTKSSGTYTVTANFAKKNLNVIKGTHDNGDFTLSTETAKMGDTITVSNITPNKGYTGGTITTSPSAVVSESGTSRTFTMLGEDVTVNASFSAKTGNTISRAASPAGGGSVYCGTSSTTTDTTSTYTTGDSLYIRAVANAAYTLSKITVTYANGDVVEETSNNYVQLNTDGSKFSDENDGSITVVATFTKKPTHKVTVVSNNNALGTATASVTEAYEGQQVTLTANEDTGSFDSWTVNSGGVTVTNNKFNMGSSDVSITANFNTYSGTSNFYYNSYGSNGQPASTNYGAQMTEAKIGGQTYSYYHVTGRSESDQLFTVSYESPKYDSYDCFFEIYKDWENGGVSAQFYASDGKNLGDWTNMTHVEDKTSTKKFKTAIPDGALSVKFKSNAGNQDKTDMLYFSDGNNGWYHTGTNFQTVTGYNQSNPVEANFWENFNSTKYTNAFESGGFNGHNANRGESHAYTKPKGLNEAQRGDYYVLVLYKGNTYTINGETKTISNDPEIIWLPELPDSGDTIKVYAKDGAIAGYGQTYADLADTTVLKADGTTSAGATPHTAFGNQTYEVYKAQPGETITIKTTIGLDKDGNALTNPTAASLRSKYYVRGFMVNGTVPRGTQITTPDITNGVYTLTYTVPEDYEGKYIEITPIYFLADTENDPVVTFRTTNFPKGQHNWGDTPYVYPYYGDLGGYNNAFGVYAGQPMFFYNGQYTMQIPKKSTAWALDISEAYGSTNNKGKTLPQVNDTPVAGVTMSNGYYDTVHKLIMGYGDNGASADHVQTYDYGDFYKIFNEKSPVDNIVFDFKYRTAKHNLENLPAASITKTTLESNYGTGGNGFEELKNFHGRNVDLFGDPLSGEQLTATPVYVVSIGGVNGSRGVENVAGWYATEWMVYGSSNGTDYSLITDGKSGGKSSIPPEVLVLNDDDTTSFNDTTYPSADENVKLTDWKDLYTALEAYRGKPVMISYEAADAQKGRGVYNAGSGGATRNDGRWLYSKNNESITSNIKIEYTDDNGTIWVDNAETPREGLSAYFTNTSVYGQQTYATTSDPDKTFDFEAKTTNASYKFVGWYMDDENKTLITTDNDGSTERSGSYTFIARFKLVREGQLILSHSVDTGTIGSTVYDGTGTVTIGAVVKDGDGNTKKTYAPSTSDITIDNSSYINSDSNCTIDVTLTATRGNNSALGTTVLATPDGEDAKFFDYGDYTLSADGNTRTYTFTVKVSDLYTGTDQTYKNLIYHSYFKNYVFNYTVNYKFNDRFGNAKIYNRGGTLTAPEAEAYVYEASGTRYLKQDFFEHLAPYESNFQQDVNWTFADSAFTEGTNDVYTCNANFNATYQNEFKKVDVTFVLPYQHTNGVATLNNGVGIADTATNYALVKESEQTDNRVTFGEIPVLTGERTNGIYDEVEKSHWIVAPLKLNDGTFFSHWSVKTTDTNTEVARCYFPGFNFLAYDNYEITAVYGEAPVNMSSTGASTAVTYLDTTRNQWNTLTEQNAIAPNVAANNTTNAGDILYNDFVLSYSYNGVEIYQGGSDTSDITELGIVVERIKELDKNSDNSYDTRVSSYTSLAQDTAKITTAATTAGNDFGQATIKDSGKQYYKQSINKTALDNKDRIVFFEAFSNTAGWNSAKQQPVGAYGYKKYVYRAYTYITYNDGSTVRTVLSGTPAYFIMYDIATADYSNK